MCELESTLLRSARSVTDDQIAERMNTYLGKRVITGDMVQKYVSGKAGVPIKYLGAFLAALGRKTIEHDQEAVSKEKLSMMRKMTIEALQREELDSMVGHGAGQELQW